MSESAHTLLGCAIRVHFKNFTHVCFLYSRLNGDAENAFFVLLQVLSSVQRNTCSNRTRLFRSVIRLYFCLLFACTRVVIGIECFVKYFCHVFVFIMGKCGLFVLSFSGVIVLVQLVCLIAPVSIIQILHSCSHHDGEVIEDSGFYLVSQ